MSPIEVRDRLLGAVQRQGLHPDRERAANPIVSILVPEVLKLLKEEESAWKKKHCPAPKI